MKWKIDKLIAVFNKNMNLFISFFSFVAVFCVVMVVNKTDYFYDSLAYYRLSQSFFVNGKFSIMNFPLTMRGIIFPLLLAPFNKLANIFFGSEILGWRLLIGVFSGIFAVSFQVIFKPLGKIRFIPIPMILLLVIWRGLFFTPLSDLVAVYFLVFALACMNKAYSLMYKNYSSISIEIFLFCLSGMFFYAAYNTRTIYLFAIPLVLFIIFVNRKIGIKKSLAILSVFCIGIFLIGCIQGSSNLKVYNTFSLTVKTDTYLGYDNLFLFQLFMGMRMNFYETYISEEVRPEYSYLDTSGIQILNEGVAAPKYNDYLNLLFKYPVEMLGLFTRHFLVLMNPISGGAYIYSRNNSRFILTLLNYTMLFITFNCLIRKVCRKNDNDLKISSNLSNLSIAQKTSILSLVSILAPFVMIIPGSVEERFALPFWLIIYGLLTYVIDLKEEFLLYREKTVFSIVSYCVGFAFLMAVLTSIYANNPERILLPILRLK